MSILIDYKNKALVNSKNNKTIQPTCFDDLVSYVSYLQGKGQHSEATKALKRVFKGEMVISNMIKAARGESNV